MPAPADQRKTRKLKTKKMYTEGESKEIRSGKRTGNRKPPLQRDERPHTDRIQVHTQGELRMYDRERGTKTKVAGKANVIERVGYAVYVESGKVCTDLLRTNSVRDYETLSLIKRNNRQVPPGPRKEKVLM